MYGVKPVKLNKNVEWTGTYIYSMLNSSKSIQIGLVILHLLPRLNVAKDPRNGHNP